MTLQNLSKILDKYDQKLGSTSFSKLKLLRGLSFYCKWANYNRQLADHTNSKFNSNFCCFNHAIDLPRKDGKEYELFDYELSLFNSLNEYKHIWIKKASGLGITEFILRYMVWLALSGQL